MIVTISTSGRIAECIKVGSPAAIEAVKLRVTIAVMVKCAAAIAGTIAAIEMDGEMAALITETNITESIASGKSG